MNLQDLKRHYTDLRIGGVTVNPIIQGVNFMLLAYLTIQELIPIYIFIPIFFTSIFFAFTMIGKKFRHIQLATDENLKYVRKTENANTIYQMMLSQETIMNNLNIPVPREFEERMAYMKSIAESEKAIPHIKY